MIEVKNLRKRYGDRVAVEDLTFTIRPGVVTGFLGPNGAGKSTTMRMMVGLDKPTSGTVTVNGRCYASHAAPMQEIGAMLDARGVHPGRSAYNHLRAIGATNGIAKRRVNEVLGLVGLETAAHRSAGSFSLGMWQRLGIAAALLGDPDTVILDEPVNGLDPEGVLWIRNLVRKLAAEGRTVFLSSHLMSEMALIAEHLVVIGRGRLIADVPMAEFSAPSCAECVRVRTPQAPALSELLAGPGVVMCSTGGDILEVTGLTAEQIGERAAGAGIILYELSPRRPSLEDVFMELTQGCVEYQATHETVAAGRATS
jgi:ABC-2 type transport system ATP-binding protein